jgi:hypothetical protein
VLQNSTGTTVYLGPKIDTRGKFVITLNCTWWHAVDSPLAYPSLPKQRKQNPKKYICFFPLCVPSKKKNWHYATSTHMACQYPPPDSGETHLVSPRPNKPVKRNSFFFLFVRKKKQKPVVPFPKILLHPRRPDTHESTTEKGTPSVPLKLWHPLFVRLDRHNQQSPGFKF